jgi:hypothetical protein
MSHDSIRKEHDERGDLAERLREFLDGEADDIRAAADALTDIADDDAARVEGKAAAVEARALGFAAVRSILESYEIDQAESFRPETITDPGAQLDDGTSADY